MRKKLLCILLIFSILLTGCFSYTDIDKALFTTSIIVDVDQDNMVVLYLECFLPFRSASKDSAKGERIIFKGRGNTVYQVMKDLNLTSSYKINYTQNKVIIFTKKATEYGIDNFIDTFQREQELLVRPYVVVYIGDPEKLIQLQLKEEQFIGYFLNNLINNQSASSRTVQIHLNEFLDNRTIGSKTNIVTTIDCTKDQLEQKLQVDGATIIKEDKFVGTLKKEDGEKYNLLMDRVKQGTLEPANPSYGNKFVTLDITHNKTKTWMSYDGKKIYLKKIINTKVAIADVQKGIVLDKASLEELRKNAEHNIKKLCTDFFDQCKKEQLDIFEIQEGIYRKYPKENIKNVMDITELDLQVNVKIDDSLDVNDFK